MSPEWIYLLKVNAGIALFYAFYKLFCQRDTFFRWRRIALLSFLSISFLYPLLNIQNWVKEQPAMYELADYYAQWVSTETNSVTPIATTASEMPDIMTICMYIYFVGIIVLSIRFIIQLLSICRMRWLGTPVYINGQRVISLPFEANPFSFFGWIFVYLPQLEEDNKEDILMHEKTHVCQWHSVDVVLSEIINIFCWFNPFSWLFKEEIRLNLEYLADNQVTELLNDCKQYQYHLLGLAQTKKQTGLYNNFNVSHLKRRIIMMNMKRTRTTGRIKYALFVPLAAALLLASNISCISTEKEQLISTQDENAEPTPTESRTLTGEIFQVVEKMPEFTGGMGECMKFLSSNINYPEDCKKEGIAGRVIIQFVVDKEGNIQEPKVVRGIHPSLDTEALRVVKAMPKWQPGTQKGEAVNVKYTIPVSFRLNGDDTNNEKVTGITAQVNEKGIYQVVEEMPEFPGGMQECMKFLGSNINYPEDCKKEGIAGRVIVQLVVNKEGNIQEPKVIRSVHPSLDAEALRVIKTMPNWKPGKHKGEAVNVKYTIPVSFRLQ